MRKAPSHGAFVHLEGGASQSIETRGDKGGDRQHRTGDSPLLLGSAHDLFLLAPRPSPASSRYAALTYDGWKVYIPHVRPGVAIPRNEVVIDTSLTVRPTPGPARESPP